MQKSVIFRFSSTFRQFWKSPLCNMQIPGCKIQWSLRISSTLVNSPEHNVNKLWLSLPELQNNIPFTLIESHCKAFLLPWTFFMKSKMVTDNKTLCFEFETVSSFTNNILNFHCELHSKSTFKPWKIFVENLIPCNYIITLIEYFLEKIWSERASALDWAQE